MTVRFNKKEDIGNLTKPILEERILKLTGKNADQIWADMIESRAMTPKRNKKGESSRLNINDLQRLAKFFILLANGVLPDQTEFKSFEYEDARIEEVVQKLFAEGATKTLETRVNG